MKPPYEITNKILNLIASVSERIGEVNASRRNDFFSRRNYLRAFKNISSATVSRDLKFAVDKGIIEKQGDKRMTKYRYVL
jgi:Fic family protein